MIDFKGKFYVYTLPTGVETFEFVSVDGVRDILNKISVKLSSYGFIDYFHFYVALADKSYSFYTTSFDSLKLFVTGFLVSHSVVSKLNKKIKK